MGEILAMLALGVTGTAHCMGMCGVLVFAFPGRTGRLSAHFFYHGGRILTYTVVGGLMGRIGSAGILEGVSGIQGGVLVGVAALLCYFGLTRMGLVPEPGWMALVSPERIPGLKGLVNGIGERRIFLLGALLGLLPCGLTFAVFTRALASGGSLQGAALAFAFGLGTLPGLLLIGTGTGRCFRKFQRFSDPVSGLILVGMAGRMGADAVRILG